MPEASLVEYTTVKTPGCAVDKVDGLTVSLDRRKAVDVTPPGSEALMPVLRLILVPVLMVFADAPVMVGFRVSVETIVRTPVAFYMEE